MQNLDNLVYALSARYKKDQGWGGLRNNHRQWVDILRSTLPKSDMDEPANVPEPPRFENREMGPPPRDDQQPPRADNRSRLREWRIPPPPPDQLILGMRLTLFDLDKEPIAGLGRSSAGYAFREITVNDKTVGWLGLKVEETLSHPSDITFLRQQSIAFYFIGGSIFVLAAIVSFLLSKHLLAPIKQLAAGTRALKSFKFDTKIDVQTGDELGQLAADFNAMAKTLKKYEEMRRQWISDISHELRTPLSILRGEIEAILDGVREMTPKTLDTLHSEILHIGKIVDDLFALSMEDSGALRMAKLPVNPVRVLLETLDFFGTSLEQKKISVETNLAKDENVTLIGDRDRLAQLFSNLFENTLRYTDKPGTLRIRSNRTHDRLTLIFEDSGPGVPQESLGKLFDRLYRVDPSRTRSKGGSGLGLSICKNIVEGHGGTIKALNAENAGLQIEITFPLAS